MLGEDYGYSVVDSFRNSENAEVQRLFAKLTAALAEIKSLQAKLDRVKEGGLEKLENELSETRSLNNKLSKEIKELRRLNILGDKRERKRLQLMEALPSLSVYNSLVRRLEEASEKLRRNGEAGKQPLSPRSQPWVSGVIAKSSDVSHRKPKPPSASPSFALSADVKNAQPVFCVTKPPHPVQNKTTFRSISARSNTNQIKRAVAKKTSAEKIAVSPLAVVSFFPPKPPPQSARKPENVRAAIKKKTQNKPVSSPATKNTCKAGNKKTENVSRGGVVVKKKAEDKDGYGSAFESDDDSSNTTTKGDKENKPKEERQEEPEEAKHDNLFEEEESSEPFEGDGGVVVKKKAEDKDGYGSAFESDDDSSNTTTKGDKENKPKEERQEEPEEAKHDNLFEEEESSEPFEGDDETKTAVQNDLTRENVSRGGVVVKKKAEDKDGYGIAFESDDDSSNTTTKGDKENKPKEERQEEPEEAKHDNLFEEEESSEPFEGDDETKTAVQNDLTRENVSRGGVVVKKKAEDKDGYGIAFESDDDSSNTTTKGDKENKPKEERQEEPEEAKHDNLFEEEESSEPFEGDDETKTAVQNDLTRENVSRGGVAVKEGEEAESDYEFKELEKLSEAKGRMEAKITVNTVNLVAITDATDRFPGDDNGTVKENGRIEADFEAETLELDDYSVSNDDKKLWKAPNTTAIYTVTNAENTPRTSIHLRPVVSQNGAKKQNVSIMRNKSRISNF